MDVLPNEEEALVQETARAFLAAEATPAMARAAEAHPLRYAPALLKSIADLGWLGISLPEEVGGQGLPLSYLGLLLEEAGRHVAPVPLHATLVPALILARHGSAAQRALLPRVIAGETLLSFAVQEPDGRWAAEDMQTVGVRDGEDFVVSGSKSFVDGFASAQHCLLAFATREGPSLALIDTASPGIRASALTTTAKDSQSLVVLESVRVPRSALLGTPGEARAALRELFDLAAVLLTCQMAGAARRTVEMAADYAKERIAFGQPIGAFQAIQHLCADMLIAVDGVQLLAREALWRLSVGLPASVEVSQAKAFANEKCLMVCRSAQQIHGGIGFMAEFDLQLWYRRVAAWAMRCGTVTEHRERVARALLDGPGKVRLDVPCTLPA
jgi:alkylation response protein AidB-like acyl-CoA dehydrogenase